MQSKKAKLTLEEDHAWTFAFGYYVDEGYSDESADRLAWIDLLLEFPRLAEYSGCEA